ncbi:WD40/YVTN/BNR-like repeat-containing protein [Spirillospora sp. CA-294931]|uniref:WD40/YVTN/BNR-like repeat-containing protein n=1 Tax=Spirillospora sp. CA-294931 TaxID=3240042 RepID=UPI003D8AC7F1
MRPQQTPGVTGAVMVRSNGAVWRLAAPLVIAEPHLLTSVAAATPTQVWVAGNAGQRPLTAHWDGTAWTLPPNPPDDPAHLGAGILGIACSPDGRAIAVGGAYNRLTRTEVPLVRHWTGSSWTPQTAPELDGHVLNDVTILNGDAWAVGHGPVAVHWTAGEWRPAPMPQVAKGKLLAVSGTAPDDIWAVGAEDRSALIVHYDGRSWTRVPCPSTRFPLTDVAALTPDEAWAVGRDRVLRWNGRKWSRVKSPVTAANTVTALSPTDIWVAGGQGELAHYDGRHWRMAPSPDTAVWLASASPAPGQIWMAGTRQHTTQDQRTDSPTIPAQTTDI